MCVPQAGSSPQTNRANRSPLPHFFISSPLLQGFTKDHGSLSSLIVHHSILQELLPCTLRLDTSIAPDRTKSSEQPPLTNGIVTLASSSVAASAAADAAGERRDNNNEELLVDIDSDPDYQRIISHFRKSMSNLCK